MMIKTCGALKKDIVYKLDSKKSTRFGKGVCAVERCGEG